MKVSGLKCIIKTILNEVRRVGPGEFVEPNGTVHDVGDITHWEWALKYVGDTSRFDTLNPLREQRLRGWIRVIYSYHDSVIMVETKRKITRQQMEHLEDQAEQTRWAVIDDDGQEIYRSADCITKENPLTESKTVLPSEFGLGNKKGRRWWMDPDANLYGFETKYNHPEWAEKYLKFVGVNDPQILNYPQGEMYKRGWVRVVFMFDRENQMVLMYEHTKPLTNHQKRELKDFAIELNVDVLADRTEGTRIMFEVTQKDLKSTMPPIRAWDIKKVPNKPVQQNPKMDMMTLDNLKALKDKAGRSLLYLKKNKPEEYASYGPMIFKQWQRYDFEIKRRMKYINQPVKESTEPSIGGSYSDQATNVAPGDITQMERDPLTDPALNGKLNEDNYKFDEYGWLASMDGFNKPVDVYYGSILLGVIESRPDGYVIIVVIGPDKHYRVDASPENKFKNKNQAAEALHRTWKTLRTRQNT